MHSEGFASDEVGAIADELFGTDSPAAYTRPGWLSVPVCSTRRRYGALVAAYAQGDAFLPQERALLEVYAQYAASALDGASALLESEARAGQSSALLGLSRSLAAAGTVGEVVSRLCEAVPAVVDCDTVTVLLRDGDELVRAGGSARLQPPRELNDLGRWRACDSQTLRRIFAEPLAGPVFINSADASDADVLHLFGQAAVALVPLASASRLLGVLALSVRARPERLRAGSDLHDRLSGVGAQAATALENARLIDLITHQATHDQLTGLANRTRFGVVLAAAVQDARAGGPAAGVLYIDLDGFKPINDVYSHDVGDRVLVAFADRLRRCLRDGDVAARLGGDEFAVVVAVSDTEDLGTVSRRVAGCFAELFVLDDLTLRLSASIGSSLHGLDGPGAEEALRQADHEMLIIKRSRGDRRSVPVPAMFRTQL